MTAPIQEPEIPDDDPWPDVSIKRMPNGKLGVLLEFPSPDGLSQFDVIAFNIEPQRAKRLRDQLDAHLKEMGF